MHKRIAILRGINVGGKRKILMADLKSMFEKMKFSNVHTYIQSGNVFFESKNDIDNIELSKNIEEALKEAFGLEVPVIVRTPKEIETAISQNPFYRNDSDIGHLHLTFLKEEPTDENQDKAKSYNYEPDRFKIKGRDIFIYCEGKYHQSKLTNNFFEKKLKVGATTRNWKTVLKLFELSKN
ncbi:DUF1697 domain-containing protein [Robertkochia aurantiaca]|uniref:DUF1697 domain-containing protein n=1 Tax=Robertkochia aurantiaca TaxID=2873700 RepID=UPI001CCA7DE6|nr:DUF1697 domain-containing protein [Robertkochia sp. 3YJGBD-33]